MKRYGMTASSDHAADLCDALTVVLSHSTTPDPQVGDSVLYRGSWGKGPQTQATVTNIDTNKGRPVVDLDDGHWAYLYQIDEVLK